MGFFDSIFSLFVKETPERRFQKQIQTRVKELAALKPPVLDRKSGWVHEDFVKMLHEIFQPLMGLLALLKVEMFEKKGLTIRRTLMERITNDNQRRILAMLDEEEVRKAAKEVSKNDFYLTMENALKTFVSLYQEDEKAEANAEYNRLQALAKLGEYDFSLFFKDFDPNYNTESQGYKPRFMSKDGKYFVEDLKTIHKALMATTFDDTLIESIGFFYQAVGKDAPELRKLKGGFRRLEELKNQMVFDRLIQILSKDFEYRPDLLAFNDSILVGLIEQIIVERKEVVEAVFARVKGDHLASLQERLFGGETAPPMRHYTARNNNTLASHEVNIFEFTGELDLVKAFLILKWGKVMKEFVNNLIIRGKFKDSAAQKTLNDGYYQLNEMLNQLQRFDEDVGDAGKMGSRIKVLMLSIKKDRKSAMALSEIISEVNKNARDLVSAAILATKSLMDIFGRLDAAHAEQSKRMLLNVLDWDGGRTNQSMARIKAFANDILLFLNVLKSLSVR